MVLSRSCNFIYTKIGTSLGTTLVLIHQKPLGMGGFAHINSCFTVNNKL